MPRPSSIAATIVGVPSAAWRCTEHLMCYTALPIGNRLPALASFGVIGFISCQFVEWLGVGRYHEVDVVWREDLETSQGIPGVIDEIEFRLELPQGLRTAPVAGKAMRPRGPC